VPVALPPKPVVAPVKAIGITGAAFGQTKPPNVFEYATSPVSIVVVPIAPTVRDTSGAPVSMGATSVSPNWKPVALKPAPLPAPERTPDVVVINYGKGGRVDEHKQRFADYRLTKTTVELRGPCYSACTLLLTYVEPENLCISPGAFMAFHAVRGLERGVRMDEDTAVLHRPAGAGTALDRSQRRAGKPAAQRLLDDVRSRIVGDRLSAVRAVTQKASRK
jgi:hypothetical protein